jgi:hypothetical protein
MGVDHTVYCGPYFECKWQGVPQTRRVFFCSKDTTHSVSSSQNFCSTCAGKIDFSDEPTGKLTSEVDWDTLHQELDERLYEVNFDAPKTDFWLGNFRVDGVEAHQFDKYEEGFAEITPDRPQREIRLTEDFYAKELEILKKHYHQVRVAWGIIGYCS